MKHIFRQAILWILLGISIYVLFRFAAPLLIRTRFWEGDYALYWSTGRLNWQRENPYSPEKNLLLQKEYGLIDPEVKEIAAMRYPPWVMPLITFFGLFDYPTSRLLWLLFNVAILFFSFEILWQLYNGSSDQHWLAHFMGFSFVPVLFTLGRGQISTLSLLGLALFLKYVQKPHHHFWAGASLVLASVKPHTLYLYFITAGLWIVKNHNWKILFGSFSAIFFALFIVFPVNPSFIGQYLTTPQVLPNTHFATPTLGTLLRVLLNPEWVWLQFIPMGIGILWLARFWCKHSQTLNWKNDTPLLILACYTTAPFLWTYDQVSLAVLGIILGIMLTTQKVSRPVIMLGGIYLVLNLSVLLLHRRLDDFWFFWLVPAWLIWYLCMRQLDSYHLYEKTLL